MDNKKGILVYLLICMSLVCVLFGAKAVASAEEASSSAIDVASGSAIDIKDVKINASSKKMGIGETLKLKLNGMPKDVTVKWKSTNKKIVTVTKTGKIHALAPGKAYVKAVTDEKTFNCKV